MYTLKTRFFIIIISLKILAGCTCKQYAHDFEKETPRDEFLIRSMIDENFTILRIDSFCSGIGWDDFSFLMD